MWRTLLPLIAVATLNAASPGQAEPRQIEHRYGITEIDGTPQRVVSLSFIGHDYLLALGVKPVALRFWYGDHPFGVWPWASEALGDAEPTVLYGDIDIEQIALLKPDLIVGQWSGMTESQYHLLSRIAPTLPPEPGESDYSSSWQTVTERLGVALNKRDEAKTVIDRLNARFEDLRQAHPDWAGQTAVVAWPPQIGVFTSHDLRSRFLHNLGFVSPLAVDAMSGGNAFFVTLPQEDLSPLDSDLLLWVHTGNLKAALDGIVLRRTMRSYREGREVYIDYNLTAALAHSSPLSLNYALDRLVPLIDAAMDGDPSTPVSSMVAEGVAP
ncbi:ABC transporter substrate-binding protein [uncultured Roseobacter sp.]|uniref:ABC transporter substrate-binding protein n=1 Tax=uncultured Roseobacter sp. TaxID=114847 RepID=UPI0026105876|nr:ABC transporter substrate-binding protein [uncultured Roseobacter sp.]